MAQSTGNGSGPNWAQLGSPIGVVGLAIWAIIDIGRNNPSLVPPVDIILSILVLASGALTYYSLAYFVPRFDKVADKLHNATSGCAMSDARWQQVAELLPDMRDILTQNVAINQKMIDSLSRYTEQINTLERMQAIAETLAGVEKAPGRGGAHSREQSGHDKTP